MDGKQMNLTNVTSILNATNVPGAENVLSPDSMLYLMFVFARQNISVFFWTAVTFMALLALTLLVFVGIVIFQRISLDKLRIVQIVLAILYATMASVSYICFYYVHFIGPTIRFDFTYDDAEYLRNGFTYLFLNRMTKMIFVSVMFLFSSSVAIAFVELKFNDDAKRRQRFSRAVRVTFLLVVIVFVVAVVVAWFLQSFAPDPSQEVINLPEFLILFFSFVATVCFCVFVVRFAQLLKDVSARQRPPVFGWLFLITTFFLVAECMLISQSIILVYRSYATFLLKVMTRRQNAHLYFVSLILNFLQQVFVEVGILLLLFYSIFGSRSSFSKDDDEEASTSSYTPLLEEKGEDNVGRYGEFL